MNQHVQRWVSGLILGPLVVFIAWNSEKLFALFIFIIVEIGVWEYSRLSFGRQGYIREKAELHLMAALISSCAYFGDTTSMMAAVICCLLTSCLLFLWQVKGEVMDVAPIEKVILGFMYLPLTISFLILLRQAPHGMQWVLFVLVLVFCGDVSGFYIGRTWGRNKLHVHISPGKTVEGTIGVLAGSVLGAFLFQRIVFKELPLFHALILGLLGGILAQLGDLFESVLKRAAHVKDASSILPGHGGMMDRLDSLTFVAPLVFYYQQLLTK